MLGIGLRLGFLSTYWARCLGSRVWCLVSLQGLCRAWVYVGYGVWRCGFRENRDSTSATMENPTEKQIRHVMDSQTPLMNTK